MPKMCPYNRAREVQRYKQKNELEFLIYVLFVAVIYSPN